MKPIKLIALDLDGTALDSNRDLSPKTAAAIHAGITSGIQVVFCTGRTLPEMRPLLKLVPDMHYLVCGNGSSVLDLTSGETIYKNKLSYPMQEKILDVLAGRDVMLEFFFGPEVFVDTACLANLERYVFDSFQRVVRESRTPTPDVRALIRAKHAPADKLHVFFRTLEERKTVWDLLKPLPLQLSSSLQNNLEINSATADKGEGLRQLCRHLHLTAEETMAVGDNCNDFTMMEFAGLAVAMENAIPEVRNMADRITKTNDADGVAYAIEQFALSQRG